MPLAAPPGPLWTADAKEPHPTGFDIIDKAEGLFSDSELCLEDVRKAVVERSKVHLADHLAENLKRSKKRLNDYVSKRAPRYRPILSRLSDDDLNIDPDISDRDLDVALHRELANLEEEVLNEGHIVMAKEEGEADYEERLAAYMAKAEDLKRSPTSQTMSPTDGSY